jgi:peptidoglycan hydrolase-like protein with peptidoglycan-binding domain
MTPAEVAAGQERSRELLTLIEQGRSTAPSREAPSAQSTLVREIQGELARLGYDPGQADGIVGAKTRSAIHTFQRDLELEPTGAVSQELLFLLKLN